jgi:hypothetical protein
MKIKLQWPPSSASEASHAVRPPASSRPRASFPKRIALHWKTMQQRARKCGAEEILLECYGLVIRGPGAVGRMRLCMIADRNVRRSRSASRCHEVGGQSQSRGCRGGTRRCDLLRGSLPPLRAIRGGVPRLGARVQDLWSSRVTGKLCSAASRPSFPAEHQDSIADCDDNTAWIKWPG